MVVHGTTNQEKADLSPKCMLIYSKQHLLRQNLILHSVHIDGDTRCRITKDLRTNGIGGRGNKIVKIKRMGSTSFNSTEM